MSNKDCITIFVTVKISADRIDAFLAAMKIDVEGSRKEEGCIRFDLIKGEEEGVYHFYEVYKDSAAVAFHKEQAHYKAWADFKAAGGVESQVSAVLRSTAPYCYARSASGHTACTPSRRTTAFAHPTLYHLGRTHQCALRDLRG